MNKHLNARQVATMFGVTVKTVQRWDRDGILVPIGRTATNRRLYSSEQLTAFAFKPRREVQLTKTIAYCRVSSATQKSDLKNQRRVIEDFTIARGLANVDFVDEVGGGLNFKRPKFLALMDSIGRGEIGTLVIAHKDRLTRFGFDWFLHYATSHKCEILVLNQEKMSPEAEMVQDLMTIVHCFSSRLYGLRNYRKSLKAALSKQEPA